MGREVPLGCWDHNWRTSVGSAMVKMGAKRRHGILQPFGTNAYGVWLLVLCFNLVPLFLLKNCQVFGFFPLFGSPFFLLKNCS